MSKHLDTILEKSNQTTNLQVVFVDIEKYSKRRTSSQVAIINVFTKIIKQSIEETAKNFIDFIQNNDINFKNDIIIIPTGDGCAVNFSFNGLHEVHLSFADTLLSNIHRMKNNGEKCDKFEDNGWCNCHDYFNVTVGITEGKGIIYKDVNDNYNVAGNVINMAARLLGIANRNQILLDKNAYLQIIDFSEDPNFSDYFIQLDNIEVKHNVKIEAYIFNPDKVYINGEIPKTILLKEKMNSLQTQMTSLGLPAMPGLGSSEIEMDYKALSSLIYSMGDLVSENFDNIDGKVIEIEQNESKNSTNPSIKKTRRSKKK